MQILLFNSIFVKCHKNINKLLLVQNILPHTSLYENLQIELQQYLFVVFIYDLE